MESASTSRCALVVTVAAWALAPSDARAIGPGPHAPHEVALRALPSG
jgi:hypothetical protein